MLNLILAGLSGVLSMLGLGLASMILLIVICIRSRAEARHQSPEGRMNRSLWIISSWALFLHFCLLIFLAVKIWMVVYESASLWQAMLAHYWIDHFSEFLIGFGVLYGAVVQHLKFDDRLNQVPQLEQKQYDKRM